MRQEARVAQLTAQSNGCEQFRVGTRDWTQCVEDQATGGGLMPWIVVIPLGVMVLGMMVGFARQFSGAGQRKARAHGASGTAGTWLIFVSFIELAIGIGTKVAANRAPGEGGGYDFSSVILLGVGILLFVIGAFLKVKGFRRARIYNSGVPGDAVIKAAHETGTMVNNQPMYAFDLEVSGQGFPPVSTRHREVVPFWFAGRVGPDSRVPVKVDPSNPSRVIFDWDRFRSSVPQTTAAAASQLASSLTGAGAQPADAAAGADAAQELTPGVIADAMQQARQYSADGPRFSAGKAIGIVILLFVLGVVGAGLYFVSSIFREVSDVTNKVTDQVSDALEGTGGLGNGFGGSEAASTIEVTRTAAGREAVTFSLGVPSGWVDATETVPEKQGAVLVDVIVKPAAVSETRVVVARSVRFLERPAPAGDDVASVRKEIEDEYGDSLARSRLTKIAGEQALQLDVKPGADGLQSRQVAVMREGQILFASVTAPQSEWSHALKAFEGVLDSWRWGTVSA